MKPYIMPARDGEYEIVIDRSRFICHIKRVYTDTDAQEFIHQIKKAHPNANHNCSAYQIGDRSEIQKANDDGEPSGTAGIPMLEVLRKQDIKNCVAVVTRYFGGIKLGAGGLIRAYGKSVSEALGEIGLIHRKTMRTFNVHTDYSMLAALQNRLESSPYLLKDIHYTDAVILEIIADVDASETFIAWMTDISQGKATINPQGTSFQEIPFSRYIKGR